MSKAIERSSPHLILSNDQIQECIEPLNIKVKSYILASSGLANTNYIVYLDNQEKVVLRIYSDLNSVKGLKELKLSTLLTNFPEVPKIHYFQPAIKNKFSYSLMGFVNGSNLSEIKANNHSTLTAVYFEIGQVLSRLTKIKFNAPGLLDENLAVIKITTKTNNHHPIVNYIIDCLENANFIKRTEKILRDSVHQLLIEQEFILNTIKQESHLVHGDFKIENIMIRPLDKQIHLSGILDWEHARSDTSYGDIATLFRGDYNKDSSLKYAFSAGYESSGLKLIKTWDKASKLVDMINLCSFLCSDNERPELFKMVINHLNHTILYFK